MKFIAHRGACLELQEDTLAALNRAAEYGAYAVECDPRYTADGRLVIFHDNDLNRLAGDPAKVSEITYTEMKEKLAAAGKELTAFDELIAGYTGSSAVLFDLSFHAEDEAFFRDLSALPFRAIAGVHQPEEAALAAKHMKKENILAFMHGSEDIEQYAEAGAGIIRLWEQWLKETPISAARKRIPADVEIWIMSCDKSIHHPLFCMNSSAAQLEALTAQGADGILLNDIALAAEFAKKERDA